MKKSFKGENPALQFITQPAEAAEPTQPAQPTEHTHVTQHTESAQPTQLTYKQGAEIKSARLNLVLRPSLAQALKQIATMRRTSVNSLISDTLQALADSESDTIAKYNATFERANENA